jgi:hypothetical protein
MLFHMEDILGFIYFSGLVGSSGQGGKPMRSAPRRSPTRPPLRTPNLPRSKHTSTSQLDTIGTVCTHTGKVFEHFLTNSTQIRASYPTESHKPPTMLSSLSATITNARQSIAQVLNFALVLSTAFMLWKGLSVMSASSSPIVVVLSGKQSSFPTI